MSIITPRDLPDELTSITNGDSLIEVFNLDTGVNEKMKISLLPYIDDQFTIGDQTVTKWSNGDMEIVGIEQYTGVAIGSVSGSIFRTSPTIVLTYLENFSESPQPFLSLANTLTPNTFGLRPWSVDVSNMTMQIYSSVSVTIDVGVRYFVKGTWK